MMADNFDRAFAVVVGIEGNYSNPDPEVDPGGETNFGISHRAYPELDIKSLTLADAKAIYAKDYWREVCCDQMPWPLALLVFDGAVNQGQPATKRTLQQALGVAVDGVIGPKTIAACFKVTAEQMAIFMALRALAYMQAKKFDPNKKGWFKRLFLVTMNGGDYGMG
ncbi:glycoside hydrolase family 108 protein [Ralstonia sp. 25C]|uniref:glycoside hydrolase family 108 protein n=1 Tax=Ralstonia sp. 25C TaxID=3447363 RepID=UPI003F74E05D